MKTFSIFNQTISVNIEFEKRVQHFELLSNESNWCIFIARISYIPFEIQLIRCSALCTRMKQSEFLKRKTNTEFQWDISCVQQTRNQRHFPRKRSVQLIWLLCDRKANFKLQSFEWKLLTDSKMVASFEINQPEIGFR